MTVTCQNSPMSNFPLSNLPAPHREN